MSREKAFCPYRVCPLGAHIDHQYGVVSGFAIDKGIEIEYEKTADGSVSLTSSDFEKKVDFNINKPIQKENDWADYLRGATASLKRNHDLSYGIKAHVKGSLPIGGLSSSAAVIIAFLSALCRVNNIILSRNEMVMTALWAENEFVGVSCGKLDQSCEVYSKKNHLLYIDMKDDTYDLIPASGEMKPFEVAIFFSGLERNLVGSQFNMRVDELKSAAYALKAFSGMEYGKFTDTRLRDVPREVFEAYKERLPENWRKRAEHYYTEFERVQKGAEAWRKGDMEAFGRLSFESGHNSIVNYETGSEQLKKIHEIMLETDGIYGGRFSGAGFKGCAMALINPEYKEEIAFEMTQKYLMEFPELSGKFGVYFANTADGVELN